MGKGQLHPSETRWHTDAATGARVRQITSAAAIQASMLDTKPVGRTDTPAG